MNVTTFGGPVSENSGADVYPGQLFRVYWSNGAGESIYRLVDNPGSGPHLLELVSEKEYGAS